MMFWKVLDKDNNIVATLHNVEYSGRYMNDRLVLSTLYSDNPIDFNIGDIVVYRGETFVLNSVPSVKKTGRAKYTYSLTFQSYTYELEFCVFRDVVLHDNNLIYANHRQVDFTGDVTYLTDRIQANLDQLYPNKWNIDVNPNIDKKLVRNISAQNSNCWNALTMVNSEYGFNFYIKGRDIFIGYDEPVIDEVFVYGEGNGAYEIERVVKKEDKIITKLSVTGTGRNLDDSYPKKPEWKDSNLPEDFFLSPLTLMIPEFKKDGKTDFVLADEKDIAKYGIREGSVVIDEIYPSITGALNNQGKPIDEIVSVGVIDNEKKHFEVHINNPNFTDNKGNKIPLKELMIPTKSKLVMKDGSLHGFGFFIIQSHEEGNKVRLVLERNSSEGMVGDTQEKFTVPNSSISMSAGDKFVFIDIFMPQNYIAQAEIRLKNRAEEILKESLKPKYSYSINVNNIFVARKKLYEDIMEGQKIHLKDKGLGIDEHILIENINIKEGESMIPDIKIVLNNEPKSSTKDIFKNQISKIEGSVTNSYAALGELNSILRKKLDKSTWDRVWEIKKDSKGKDIIYGKLPVVTKYGITMNAILDDIDVPTLMDAISVDGTTIRKRADGALEVIGGTGGTIIGGVFVNDRLHKPNNKGVIVIPDYPKNITDLANDANYITDSALMGYATQSWSNGRFALKTHKHSWSDINNTPTTLDGYGITDAMGFKYPQADSLTGGLFTYGNPERGFPLFGGAISVGSNSYFYQLQANNAGTEMKYRGFQGGFSPWKTIAFTDSNVASATKLQAPRKLWGQSFDGTQDVSGSMLGVGNVNLSGDIVSQGYEFTGDNNHPRFRLKKDGKNMIIQYYDDYISMGLGVVNSIKVFENGDFHSPKDLYVGGGVYNARTLAFASSVKITDGFGENILETLQTQKGTTLSLMEESLMLNNDGALLNGKFYLNGCLIECIDGVFYLHGNLITKGSITMDL